MMELRFYHDRLVRLWTKTCDNEAGDHLLNVGCKDVSDGQCQNGQYGSAAPVCW